MSYSWKSQTVEGTVLKKLFVAQVEQSFSIRFILKIALDVTAAHAIFYSLSGLDIQHEITLRIRDISPALATFYGP
jgi:hypothetical protein